MAHMPHDKFDKIMRYLEERLALMPDAKMVPISKTALEEHNVTVSDILTKSISAPLAKRGIEVRRMANAAGVVLMRIGLGKEVPTLLPNSPDFKPSAPIGQAQLQPHNGLSQGRYLRPKIYGMVRDSVARDMNVYIYGPSGCGKTSMCKEISRDFGLTFSRFNFHGETTVDNLLGTPEFSGDKTYFRKGILPVSAEEGHLLLLDEVDSALPGVLFPMHALLEHPRSLTLPGLDGKEQVLFHEKFRCVAAGNTSGAGDLTGLYQGTNVMNAAFRDRFDIYVHMDYPENEKEILSQYTHPKVAEELVKVAKTIRLGSKEGRWNALCSTRRLITISQWVDAWGMKLAFQNCLLSSLDDDTARTLKKEISELR